jgi:CDP-glycerol glycerophosphotransferase
MLHDLDTIRGRDEGYVQRATNAASQWSVLVSPSPFVTDVMRSAFRYSGRVIEQGYPRNDLLLRPDRDEIAARVRRNLGIDENATVVLYAPTFRDNQTSAAGRFTFELPLDLERFRETHGENVVLLLRMHVLVRGRIQIPDGCETTVRNVSTYPEIQELYLASDVLVTDYSSVFFDFAALRRPMVFYAYDLESYRDNLRGFYLDFEREVPGPVVTTECALHKALMSLDTLQEEYGDRYDAFLARFSPRDDGHAARRVVDEVFGPEGETR